MTALFIVSIDVAVLNTGAVVHYGEDAFHAR